MGGPCFLVEERPDTGKPGPRLKKTPAPDCTDNFQIVKFEFEGKEWFSVEQAYQGMKFKDDEQEIIRAIAPNADESSHDYGQRIWRHGQQGKFADSVNTVELMYKLCCAKYVAHPEMQQALLSTGTVVLHGGPSTGEWSKFNGLIQTLIREELRSGKVPGSDLSGPDLMAALESQVPALMALGLVESLG